MASKSSIFDDVFRLHASMILQQQHQGNQENTLTHQEGREYLVNLLHGALALGSNGSGLLALLLSSFNVLVDVQSELDKLVDALGKLYWLVDSEAGNEKRSLVEKSGDALDGFVVLAVGLDLALELLDDGTLGRDFEGLLRLHVRAHAGVTKSLCLHDTLHVGRPAELTSADGARGASELVRDDDLFDLVTENIFESLGKTFVLLLFLFARLLLLVGLLKLKVLGDIDELLAVEFLELSHGILVNGVGEKEHLEVLVFERIKERRLENGLQ